MYKLSSDFCASSMFVCVSKFIICFYGKIQRISLQTAIYAKMNVCMVAFDHISFSIVHVSCFCYRFMFCFVQTIHRLNISILYSVCCDHHREIQIKVIYLFVSNHLNLCLSLLTNMLFFLKKLALKYVQK